FTPHLFSYSFFYSYLDHRHLHSFPTRRSSDLKDVHMTDLVSGREDLSDVQFIVFVGGFSNSDVLGSAKGWAGAFLYNPKAKQALDRKSTRLNSSHVKISYAVFCLKKKKITNKY